MKKRNLIKMAMTISVVSLDTKTTKVSVELHIGKQTEEEGGTA
jgi:hypothetical protein